ncbi:MAG: undecaprenyl-diphosphate phosphatase [Bacteroidales bacterium]|nr:undecaprenyl-diphosphate phosphatase [Bacteroidales bacterium]
MKWIDLIIISIVEGLTEFLPISSTGHMIITQKLLGISDSNFIKTFIVNIQFGAILSVVVLYFKHFIRSLNFYKILFIAFLPSAFVGFLLNNIIDKFLENVFIVAIMLIIGGVIFLFIDKYKPKNYDNHITLKKSFIIGCFQCFALIPGISRSAATIIGGLLQKLDRKTAAEFSFFLAVPTMFAASFFKVLKNINYLKITDFEYLFVGNIISFVVAMIAIKFFINFLTRFGFYWFGWYRILVGIVILILFQL